MHPIVKIIFGAILVIGSVTAVFYSRGTAYDLWRSFKTVVMGIVPPFVFLIGLFVIWLELDELRIERELKAEERRARRTRRPRRPRRARRKRRR